MSSFFFFFFFFFFFSRLLTSTDECIAKCKDHCASRAYVCLSVYLSFFVLVSSPFPCKSFQIHYQVRLPTQRCCLPVSLASLAAAPATECVRGSASGRAHLPPSSPPSLPTNMLAKTAAALYCRPLDCECKSSTDDPLFWLTPCFSYAIVRTRAHASQQRVVEMRCLFVRQRERERLGKRDAKRNERGNGRS